jgi:hypothetical protein
LISYVPPVRDEIIQDLSEIYPIFAPPIFFDNENDLPDALIHLRCNNMIPNALNIYIIHKTLLKSLQKHCINGILRGVHFPDFFNSFNHLEF